MKKLVVSIAALLAVGLTLGVASFSSQLDEALVDLDMGDDDL